MLVLRREENRRKTHRAGTRTNDKLNPYMTSNPGIEPGRHWWEASALTTAPSLLSVSNLLCFSKNSSSSTLPLRVESQRRCGDLEGTVEAEAPVPTMKKGIKRAIGVVYTLPTYLNNRVVHVTIIRILFNLEQLHSETVFHQKLKHLPLYLHLNKPWTTFFIDLHFQCSLSLLL